MCVNIQAMSQKVRNNCYEILPENFFDLFPLGEVTFAVVTISVGNTVSSEGLSSVTKEGICSVSVW